MSDSHLTLGLVGAGRIGEALARVALAAGDDVVLSNSRGPDTLADLVAELGPRARAATAQEAAAAGDVVVVTVPLGALADVPVEPLAGTVVIDTLNYYPDRDGHVAALDERRATTSGLVQEHLVGARVVKAFGTMHSGAITELARPAGAQDRSTMPIFGDDPDAKDVVRDLLDRWGFDVLDGGGLDESWRAENGQPAYGLPYGTDGDLESPQPASRERIAALLAEADRHAVDLFTFVQPD